MKEEKKKIRLADIGRGIWQGFLAVIKGEFLTRIKSTRYFMHIIWTFMLFFAAIWMSIKIEGTLAKVEDKIKERNDMAIYKAQVTVELQELQRMTRVEARLKDMGSDLRIPTVPSTTMEPAPAKAEEK